MYGDSIFEVVTRNDINLLKKLIKHNADINVTDNNGMSLLHLVSDTEIANLLIKQGININATNNAGSTPIHWAVSKKNYSLVRLLLEYGAEINQADINGNTPLHLGAITDPYMIRLLLQGGADISRLNKKLLTPLQVAWNEGFSNNVQYLNTSFAKTIKFTDLVTPKLINSLDQQDQSKKILDVTMHPAIGFILRSNFEEAEKLIAKETNVNNIKDQKGNSALHWAIIKKNRGLVKNLLNQKADPNLKNMDQQSSLDILKMINDKSFSNYVIKLVEEQKKISKSIDK